MPSPIPAGRVVDRVTLEDYLGQSLLSEYYERVDGRITRQVTTALKTYLVELHQSDGGVPAARLSEAFSRVRDTSDDRLVHATDDRGNDYFIDLLHSRLALVHSIAHTNQTDRTVGRLTRLSGVDRCWLPSTLLLNRQLGRLIGFRFFHQALAKGLVESALTRQLAEDLGRSDPPPFRLALTEYANAAEDLATLREGGFASRSSIDSLAWRSQSDVQSSDFIHDQVWADGKITAYGNSWSTHLRNVLMLRDHYAATLELLEGSMALRWTESGFAGEPIHIDLPRLHVESLEALVTSLTDGTAPFRLWGAVAEATEDLFVVDAIDLHTNHRLSLEVRRDSITVYLRRETCGNVLLRLLVNIERYVSSELQTSVDDVLAGRRS